MRFKAGPKGRKTVHDMVEEKPTLRKTMVQQGRLYVGFRALAVRTT